MMFQFRTGMNGRQFLALLNSKPIQFFQFNTKTTFATPALQKQQACLFGPAQIVRNSSGIASPLSGLDVLYEKETAKNEEFSVEKEEEEDKIGEQEAKKQAEVFEPGGKETIGGPKTLAQKNYYPRGMDGRRLHVKYDMGKSGNKFLQIRIENEGKYYNFANILVPQDVFGFVRAMDEVLEAVHAKRSIIEASSNRQERLYLHTAKAKGINYDFQLELFVLKNVLQVRMRTVPNEHKPEHKPRHMFLPLHQFQWLRIAIGELFAESGEEDVQRQLGKSPNYPAWLNFDGIPHALSSNVGAQRQKKEKHPIAAQLPQSQLQMAFQQQQAMLQQLLQLVLQQQQQLQQMQAANATRNNNLEFCGFVPKGSDQIILMSDLLAQQKQQQQAFTLAAPTMQIDQTALANLLAQYQHPQQPMASTMNNNNQLANLVNLLQQNNSGQQN